MKKVNTFQRALRASIRWENKHRLIPHFVVFCILSFLAAKLIFRSNSSNALLFGYGIAVTTMLFITFIVSFTLYKDPSRLAQKKKKTGEINPFVSFIVAVHNEEDIITQCVESLTSQTYTNREVIIIDDASTDNTPAILKKLQKIHTIKVIFLTDNVGKKKALGAGVAAAKGTIFAFTDSDSTWAPDAITNIVPIFETFPEVGAVSGHTRALNGDKNILTKAQDSWYEGQYSIRKAYESVFGSVTCVSGPLAVFRKEAIYNYMPAWEKDQFLGQEFKFATDRTLTGIVLGSKYIGSKLRAKYTDPTFASPDYKNQEWKIVYCKSAKAWTEVPDTFTRVIKQQVRWKKSFIRNIFFTGAFFWRRPFAVSMNYYLHIAFVLLGPFIAFRHLVYLPLQGNFYSMFLYLAGICFIGFMFGLAFKLENPESDRWVYRPIMSLLSTLVLSWLIFYSASTIKKMTWSRT